MRAFKPQIGYGERALKASRHLSALEHTRYHQDLNAFLRNYKGKYNLMPRKGTPGTEITEVYGFSFVERALRGFHATHYPEKLPLFEGEVIAIKKGLNYVP